MAQMTQKNKITSLTVCLALAVSCSTTMAQAPELGGLLPSGGPRGAITRVQIDGKHFAGAKLFLSGRGVKLTGTQISASGDLITVDVQVEPGAPLGPHEVRIATAKGVSNGARFWVDVHPNKVIEKPMSESASPVAIDGGVPVVINSRIASKSGRDRFVLNVNAGEIWTFQCLADAIRSRMDPVLELRDDAGVNLQLAQGAWESDPRFSYRFAKSGRYFLNVRDSEYNGGPNYTYRLLAAKAPLVTGYTPRGERPGHTVEIALQGVNLASERASVTIPGDASGVYWADILAGSSGSIVLPLLIDTAQVQDAGDGDGIRPLSTVPVAVDGRFSRNPRVRFSFHASKGSKTLFDLLGRRIGSRIDGSIRVLDSAGKELAVNDDAPGLGKDARLEFSAPTDADYQVEASNVEEITGPDCYYRLKVTPVVPDYQIVIASDRLTVPAAGTVAIPITVERLGGFSGPISVRAAGLPAGVTASGGLVPAGKSATEVLLTAAPETSFTASAIRLIGEATIGAGMVRHEAPAWEKYEHRSIDLLLSVEYSYTRPHHIWDMLLLGVTDRTDPITVTSTATNLALSQGGTVEIPVHVVRHPGAAGAVKLDLRGLPGNITVSAPEIPANQSDGKIVLTAAANANSEAVDLIVQARLGNSVALLPALRLTVSKK